MFKCTECGRSLDELKMWGKAQFCGDHWRCTNCDANICRNVTLEQCQKLADLIGGKFGKNLVDNLVEV